MKKLLIPLIFILVIGCATITPLQQAAFDTVIVIVTSEMVNKNPEISNAVINITEGLIAGLEGNIPIVLIEPQINKAIAESGLTLTSQMALQNWVLILKSSVIQEIKDNQLGDKEVRKLLLRTVRLINMTAKGTVANGIEE